MHSKLRRFKLHYKKRERLLSNIRSDKRIPRLRSEIQKYKLNKRTSKSAAKPLQIDQQEAGKDLEEVKSSGVVVLQGFKDIKLEVQKGKLLKEVLRKKSARVGSRYVRGLESTSNSVDKTLTSSERL